jgi:FMN phosphatase YigB (HAD superfamily)
VSATIGITKSGEFGGEKIFELALSRYGDIPDEAVFIDNTEINLVISQHGYAYDLL